MRLYPSRFTVYSCILDWHFKAEIGSDEHEAQWVNLMVGHGSAYCAVDMFNNG